MSPAVTPAHLWALRMVCGLDSRGLKPWFGTSHVWIWQLEQRDENTPLDEDQAVRVRKAGADLLGRRWFAILEDYLAHNPIPPRGQRNDTMVASQRRANFLFARAIANDMKIRPERLFFDEI